MAPKLQPARGTKDIAFEEYRKFSHIVHAACKVADSYCFDRVSTPIFEFTEVFKRTLGDVSDIVNKEMYSFDDRGGEGITLRPEFTAGVCRAFLSNGWMQQTPLKLFSYGPLFRYERPQKGRQRQFHQLNFEYIGVKEPKADVEIISLASLLLKKLGLENKTKIEINSLGDKESREKYRDTLVEYLNDYKNKLSDDSKIRLEKNPMRILDSKDDGDKKIVADAPQIESCYTTEAQEFFSEVKEGLDALAITYAINPNLVRGLDYYCHTAFECTTELLGAQNAVLAGGRYDGLIEQMGGPSTPAIGFAGGIERLMELCDQKPKEKRPIVLVPIGEKAEKKADTLAFELRKQGLQVDLAFSGNVAKRMKKANKANAKAAIIFGEEELSNKSMKLKDFDSGEEKSIKDSELASELTAPD